MDISKEKQNQRKTSLFIMLLPLFDKDRSSATPNTIPGIKNISCQAFSALVVAEKNGELKVHSEVIDH